SSDGRHEVRVSVDLIGYEARKYCDRQLVDTKSFDSLGSMVCQYLSQLDLNELIRLSQEEIERAGRNNYMDCVNAILQAVIENFDGQSLSFSAPEGPVVKFGEDCLEYTLATMINRMPDTVSVRPENREWAVSITPDVWQTDRFDFLGTIRLESGVRTDTIEFLGPMLSVFADYARQYIDDLRENEKRDVIRYAEGKMIDPEKQEIYDFADRLDRLEGSFDVMKYLKKMDDRGISCWDNVQHYYDLLAAGDLTEIRELLNTVMLVPDDSGRASMARVMTEELNERERDFSRGTAEAAR
ncbi:MAG: DUF3849 domain-containing protein, partial [Oscillospiraceae bacterium]|nr:DUF3849 domain-containing protein [Oscillospiraceae bacterium]